VPVHFQAYLSLGAGVGSFHRQSAVYCLSPQLDAQGAPTGSCGKWLEVNRVAPLASAAAGMRFFTGPHGAVELELRDYGFIDQYRVGIDRTLAEKGDPHQGREVHSGLSQIWTLNLGYGILF
jgi:hypothetical protein